MDRAIEAFIRISLIAILAAWCFEIVRPFIVPVIWGLIIAIGLYPGYRRLRDVLGGRRVWAAVILSLLTLVILLVPTALLSGSLVDAVQSFAWRFEHGELSVPPPPEWVADLPLIGASLDGIWADASSDLESALIPFAPQVKATLSWLLGVAAGVSLGMLQFVFAIAIAGVLLAQSDGGRRVAMAVSRRLAGARGEELANLAEATIRSVTRGILGVALIQSLMAGLGWLAVGIPGAGLWALLALVLSTVQVGIFPVTLPTLVYGFYYLDTPTFLLFLVWTLFVSSLDNILKPILLGRGVQVPMAVVFVGAIGGLLSSGIIGLFVGSVILVLGYKLFLAWLEHQELGRGGRSISAARGTGEDAR